MLRLATASLPVRCEAVWVSLAFTGLIPRQTHFLGMENIWRTLELPHLIQKRHSLQFLSPSSSSFPSPPPPPPLPSPSKPHCYQPVRISAVSTKRLAWHVSTVSVYLALKCGGARIVTHVDVIRWRAKCCSCHRVLASAIVFPSN